MYTCINEYIYIYTLHRCIKTLNNKGRLTIVDHQVFVVDGLLHDVCKCTTLDNVGHV